MDSAPMQGTPATTQNHADRESTSAGLKGALVASLAIGAGALVVRLAFVTQYAGHPLGRLPWVDEGAYWARAQEIVAGQWLPERPYFQDPLFPYLLAALIRLVGPDVARLRVALACLGALTPVAVYWAGRIGFGRAEGLVAGALAAACGPWIFTDGQLEKEGAAALFVALALVATARASEASVWRAGAAGWTWGIVALLRANALALAPLGFVWCLSQKGRRRAVVSAGFYLAGFALAIAPATIVNAWVSRPRQLIMTTWQGGANFYIGNGPEATGTYAAPEFVEANPAREADDFATEASRRAGRRLTETEVSRFWFHQGLAHWVSAPAASFRLLGRKLAFVLNDREIPDNQDFEGVRLLAAPRLGWGIVTFGVLLPLAALGLSRRERSRFWWFLVLSTGTGLVTTALFFVVGRYRIPWLPGLTLLAASGIVETARQLAARRWWAVASPGLILVLPVTVAAWWPLNDPSPDRWGHQEVALAVAYLNDWKLGPAIDALDDARALAPGSSARVSALLASGPVHDRVAMLIGVRLGFTGESNAVSEVERARLYRQLPERREESRRLLLSRLREAPDDPTARREWGAWWLGDPDKPGARQSAREELTRAASPPEGDVSASVLLALLTSDPSLLPTEERATSDPQRTRFRLARAAIAAQQGSRGGP
jgi:4-amino-4-deoxy-L-arabinose transferase-like glycosyltransferase